MRIIALLEVDETVLAETGRSFGKDMEWIEQSGIRLLDHKEITEKSDYEYAAFVWNKRLEKYEQIGRPVGTVMFAINRYQAYAKNGWFCRDYDTNKAVFKRRIVSKFCGEWEEVGNEE